MLNIVKANYEEIVPFRIAYLESLTKFQDIFLEFLIADSTYYKLKWYDNEAGYFIVSTDKVLIEFYLIDNYIPNCSELLKTIIENFQIVRILCKSFDFTLLNCCIINKYKYKPIGLLYRDYIGTHLPEVKDWTVKYATNEDLTFLNQQDDEVFGTKELLGKAIENEGILFFYKEENLIGCGFLTQIHPNWDYYDIGVWTSPEFRKQGFGTKIINYLKNNCLQNCRIPILGCDINNIASQKTIVKVGFISKHVLIEFETK